MHFVNRLLDVDGAGMSIYCKMKPQTFSYDVLITLASVLCLNFQLRYVKVTSHS